jgi:large subunit ribosomal protein L4
MMSKIEIKNAEGKTVDTVEFNSDVFGIEPNIPVIHQVVTVQLGNLRQGTHDTKGRSEVSGGGAKPWRQKGTGRARQGSTRATQWVGGGVPFGPTPRTHNRRLNNKEVKLAMRGVLSGKVRDNELVVVDNYGFDKPSTKQAVALLKALELEGKRVTLVVSDDDVFTYLSFRNVETVRVLGVGEVTTHTLIDNAALVLSTEVAKKLEEVLA